MAAQARGGIAQAWSINRQRRAGITFSRRCRGEQKTK